MWVPFNEGWGQHETEKYVAWLKTVRSDAPGQQHQRLDRHEGRRRRRTARVSRARRCRRSRTKRAAVLGEFGGLGLPLEGTPGSTRATGATAATRLARRTGRRRIGICSRSCGCIVGDGPRRRDLHADDRRRDRGQRRDDLRPRRHEAVAGRHRRARRAVLAAPRPRLVPASDRRRSRGATRPTAPPPTGSTPPSTTGHGSSGPRGFGARDTRFARVGTAWKTPDIWLRRTFDMPAAGVDQSAPARLSRRRRGGVS